MTTTATAPDMGASAASTACNGRKPVKLRERIGSTTYEVKHKRRNYGGQTPPPD